MQGVIRQSWSCAGFDSFLRSFVHQCKCFQTKQYTCTQRAWWYICYISYQWRMRVGRASRKVRALVTKGASEASPKMGVSGVHSRKLFWSQTPLDWLKMILRMFQLSTDWNNILLRNLLAIAPQVLFPNLSWKGHLCRRPLSLNHANVLLYPALCLQV